MQETIAQALDRAWDDLARGAIVLGADSAAVLLNAGGRTDITWLWKSAGAGDDPARHLSNLERRRYESLIHSDGPIEATSPAGQFLREILSSHSRSFLVHRWHVDRQAVTIVFGFPDPASAPRAVPDNVVETLNFAGLAAWSASAITRLSEDLKTANVRLAGRKLVERAKGVLQAERGVTEELAYAYLRSQSRKRRIALTKLAEEVLRGSRSPRANGIPEDRAAICGGTVNR
jgi:ANTAR domain